LCNIFIIAGSAVVDPSFNADSKVLEKSATIFNKKVSFEIDEENGEQGSWRIAIEFFVSMLKMRHKNLKSRGLEIFLIVDGCAVHSLVAISEYLKSAVLTH
jgi:hypothetical protein